MTAPANPPARRLTQVTCELGGRMKNGPILPLLREIDLRTDLDLALALRRIGRERRQERARRDWRTRMGR